MKRVEMLAEQYIYEFKNKQPEYLAYQAGFKDALEIVVQYVIKHPNFSNYTYGEIDRYFSIIANQEVSE